jgi:hypothetical protein
MFECSKHVSEVAWGIVSAKRMFCSFRFWSFEFVVNFVLRYSNFRPVTKDHGAGPF